MTESALSRVHRFDDVVQHPVDACNDLAVSPLETVLIAARIELSLRGRVCQFLHLLDQVADRFHGGDNGGKDLVVLGALGHLPELIYPAQIALGKTDEHILYIQQAGAQPVYLVRQVVEIPLELPCHCAGVVVDREFTQYLLRDNDRSDDGIEGFVEA